MSSVFKSERKCSYDPTKDSEMTGYEALAFAIVRQAVEDYKNAVVTENERARKPLLRFFDSPWCQMLIDLDMPSVARRLDRNVKEFFDLAKNEPDRVLPDFDRLTIRESTTRFPAVPAFRCPVCRGLVQTRWGSVSYTVMWENRHTKHKVYHYGWVVRCTDCGMTAKFPTKDLDERYKARL